MNKNNIIGFLLIAVVLIGFSYVFPLFLCFRASIFFLVCPHHDYLSITDEEIPAHSSQYAKAAAEPGADEICIKGAKGLAMTGLDLLLNESLRQAAAEYHEKVVPDFYKEK